MLLPGSESLMEMMVGVLLMEVEVEASRRFHFESAKASCCAIEAAICSQLIAAYKFGFESVRWLKHNLDQKLCATSCVCAECDPSQHSFSQCQDEVYQGTDPRNP